MINLSELSKGLTCADMEKHMLEAFRSVYNLSPDPICEIESEKISELSEKYASWDYIYGTHFPFSFSCESRFLWGQANLQIQVEKGKIAASKLYTDSMDWELSEKVEKALLGCRFDKKECEKALLIVVGYEYTSDFMSLLEKII